MQTLEVGEVVRLTGTFSDIDGAPADPATVTLTITLPDGTTTTVTNVGLTNPAVGTWYFDYPTTLVGGHAYRFEGSGTITQGETGYFIVQEVGVSFPQGPCEPWTTVSNVRACCSSLAASGSPEYLDDYVVQSAIDLASDLLYSFSGQQYPGNCLVSVRPCGTPNCYYASLSTDPSSWPPPTCGCSRLHQVDLGAWWPITAITSVLVDGAAIDSTSYRLDENRYLVRMAGAGPDYVNDGWPHCQHLDRPTTEPGTWAVSFIHGMEPPPGGKRAASILACELLKACTGQVCQLPKRANNVNRQGINIGISLIDPSMLEKGLTGVYEADLFISSVNPKGYRGGAMVWSPDLPMPPRRI